MALIFVFFFKNIFRYGALYFIAPLRYGIIYDLRKQLYQKFLELPLSFYSNERKGVLLSSMTSDVQEIEWSVLNVIEAIFKAPIIMLGSIFFMFYISPSLTLFVFVPLSTFGFIALKAFKYIRPIFRTRGQINAEVTGRLTETLAGVRVIKAFWE